MGSNWSENQNKMKERKEEDKLKREKLAGYFFNLSQLTFAAIVLGGFSPLFSEGIASVNVYGLLLGGLMTAFLAIIGYSILKQRKL